jgi:glycosyltransferase involved in cell wall biosynthesis
MRIAFVHPAHRDYRQQIFEHLNENYDVTFIFTSQGRGQENVEENHMGLPPSWKCKVLTSNFLIGRYDIFMFIRLMNELFFGRYDIIMCSTCKHICYVSAKISRAKFIILNEFWYFESNSLKRSIFNSVTKFIVKNSDSVISLGSRVTQEFLSWGVETHKIYEYPQCAMDYTSIVSSDPSELRKKYGVGNKKVIFFVGRFVEFKGVEYLIRAFSMLEKKYDNSFLIIGGKGYKEGEYCKLIDDLNIKNILIITDLSDYEKANIYNMCNVFVLPSIFFSDESYEAWGLVVNEALAFGKPVITTDAVGSGYDLVEYGLNGFVVKNKNVEELFLALYKIVSNGELEIAMGKRSKEIFKEKNNYLNFFQTFKNSIDSCLNPNPNKQVLKRK